MDRAFWFDVFLHFRRFYCKFAPFISVSRNFCLRRSNQFTHPPHAHDRASSLTTPFCTHATAKRLCATLGRAAFYLSLRQGRRSRNRAANSGPAVVTLAPTPFAKLLEARFGLHAIAMRSAMRCASPDALEL